MLRRVTNKQIAAIRQRTVARWNYHAKYKYYYRSYSYKPGHHHYAIYHPSRGKRVYCRRS